VGRQRLVNVAQFDAIVLPHNAFNVAIILVVSEDRLLGPGPVGDCPVGSDELLLGDPPSRASDELSRETTSGSDASLEDPGE
jgi:hypothetical protein